MNNVKKFIPISEPNIGKNEIHNVVDAVKSGWVSSLGDYIIKFENGFAKYCGRKYGVATANGTVALHLALVALGIGKGDEVIVPNFTFIATANAVTYTGAKVVLVDVEPDTWNMDARKIEDKINKKTKAIIPVPIYGQPCDMDAIKEIAKKYNLFVVEDAAESHGAVYKGKKVGSFGDVSCFSFYGNKTITTGEGGMCLNNNKKIYKKMLLLRDHAMSKEKRYWHDMVGYNYRMTNLQAALGMAQLERIDELIEKKRQVAKVYIEELKSIESIILPINRPACFQTYWMFSILIKKDAKFSRDTIIKLLKKKGIDSRPFFYPLSDLPPYKLSKNKDLKVSLEIAYRGINLPSSTKLKKEEIVYICNVLKGILL